MAPTTVTERVIDTNGVRLRTLEAGDRDGPVVLLAHGFPELAYSWRHQIPALAAAGYHVLAPDQRGYGGSSKPDAVEDYDIVALTGDLIGLLDDVGAPRAVIVGHDWGSTVAFNTPLLHPDRVAGLVCVSVPPIPRPKRPPTEIWREIFGDNFFYILYFQEPGVADTDLGRDPATTMRRMLAGLRPPDEQAAAMAMLAPGPDGYVARLPDPQRLPDWLTADELEHYIAEFTRTGFTGPLNWYRNFDRNWELTVTTPAAMITAPTLFIGGTADPMLRFIARDRYPQVVSGPYRELMIDDAGHWIQQERPEEVNEAVLEFLSGLELQ